ncbi:hypothetical protein HRR83_007184 [Exophiala dermatitidis]|nr:hypothetical protein HRR73_006476 [Exophiala dermatitidis]KAJ4511922.1 hypothetical protein HRR74_006656 [Exophiala dermatitidis]KAJ4534783.1 hypothetical protein HRR76_006692 [Exophiala dermatitidis]KAJ4550867.1 hypothetical protein HRR77_003225 [Exophiala dermatitidis]KAJ4562008.1 hypothetical protein HRR79_006871 [Exophiala dermatitidis]
MTNLFSNINMFHKIAKADEQPFALWYLQHIDSRLERLSLDFTNGINPPSPPKGEITIEHRAGNGNVSLKTPPVETETATPRAQAEADTMYSHHAESNHSSSASFNSSSSSEPSPQDSLLELINTPDRGMGVFARRKIKAGTLVLVERPLIILDKDEETNPAAIEREFAALSRADQKVYLRLWDAEKSGMSRVVSIYYSNCYNCDEFVKPKQANTTATTSSSRHNKHDSSAVRDARTTAGGGSAIGAFASRLNHSCVPNVQFSYDETTNEMQFRAIRDIARGKEICSNYDKVVFETRSKRQRKQQIYYGFVCTCEACEPHTEFWARSDERRKGMYAAFRIVLECEKRYSDNTTDIPTERNGVHVGSDGGDNAINNSSSSSTKTDDGNTATVTATAPAAVTDSQTPQPNRVEKQKQKNKKNKNAKSHQHSTPTSTTTAPQDGRPVHNNDAKLGDQGTPQPHAASVNVINEALTALTKLETLLLKEALLGTPLANTYRSMAKWAERKHDILGSIQYKRKELDVCRIAFGERAVRCREIEDKLDKLAMAKLATLGLTD